MFGNWSEKKGCGGINKRRFIDLVLLYKETQGYEEREGISEIEVDVYKDY